MCVRCAGAGVERLRGPHRADAGGADPGALRARRGRARGLVPALARAAPLHHVRLHDRRRRITRLRRHAHGREYHSSLSPYLRPERLTLTTVRKQRST